MVKADTIEVRLFDPYFNKFYQTKADVNNRKQMKLLIQELKDKGVSFNNKGWFD